MCISRWITIRKSHEGMLSLSSTIDEMLKMRCEGWMGESYVRKKCL